MAVTDLTNTKWLLNDSPSFLSSGSYSVNFISNLETFNDLSYTYASRPEFIRELYYNSIVKYSLGSGWVDSNYRTIEITGGTDVTNTNLISWLTANATQITSGGSMYLGTSNISKMYLGQNEVSKVYLGQDLVYEKQASGV